MPESHFYHISNQGKVTANGSLVEAILAANMNGYVWADLVQPSPEDLKQLRDPLGLDPQAVADWSEPNLLAKMAHFPRNTYLRMHRLSYAEKISGTRLDCFIGEKFLLTLNGSAASTDPTALPESISGGPAFLLHTLLQEQLGQRSAIMEQQNNQVWRGEQDFILREPTQAIQMRRDLLSLQKHLTADLDILEKITRKETPFVTGSATALYQALHERTAALYAAVEERIQILNDTVDLYLSTTLRQTQAAVQSSQGSLRRLALVVTVVMPVILFLAINAFAQIPKAPTPVDARIAFLIILFCMALIGYIVYRLLGWPNGNKN